MELNDYVKKSFNIAWTDGVILEIKPLPLDKLNKILAKNTSRIIVNKRTKETEEVTDHVQFIKDVAKATLVGWSGLLRNGEPVEFSDETRDYMLMNFHELSSFLNELSVDLEALRAAEVKEEIKN